MSAFWFIASCLLGVVSLFSAFFGLMCLVDGAWHAPLWQSATILFIVAWGCAVFCVLGFATVISLGDSSK
jgi:hypothetical protein